MSERTKGRNAGPGTPVPDGRHHLLIPVSVLTSAALLYGFHVSFGVVFGVAAAFLTLYLFAPSLSRRSREAFDRDALAIRAGKGGDKAKRLGERLDAAWPLRLLGAPADVHARRAMVAEEASRPREARDGYRKALDAWEGESPLATLVGYANASYLAGDDVEAVMSFQKVIDRGAMLPRLHVRIAHATLRAGLPSEGVAAWLDTAERDADDEDARREVTLVRALHDATRGERDAARAKLSGLPKDLGSLATLRDEVKEAIAARR